MEAFTRLQKDLHKVEDNPLYAKPRNREDQYQKTNPKQVPKSHKAAQAQAKRNSLTKATTSLSLVPVNPIYENLDPEKLKNFSLPRIRQLWCADPNCTYNSNIWTDQNGIQRSTSSMSHHLHRDCSSGNGENSPNDIYTVRTHQSKRHDVGDGQVGYYEDEVEDIRRGGKLKRPGISPAASNSASYSTESTGLSSRNKRSEGEMSDNSVSGPLHIGIPNTDFHQSFKSSTNSRGSRPSNGPPSIYAQTGNYPQPPSNPFCPSCNGVIPLSHLETIPEMSSFKAENGLWNFNNFHYPLQRDSSIGGFTLNGQPRPAKKKSKMAKFCSSHKIALVVSTFSLLVTIGLIITLLLMKKKGMMEPM